MLVGLMLKGGNGLVAVSATDKVGSCHQHFRTRSKRRRAKSYSNDCWHNYYDLAGAVPIIF